MLTKAKSVKLIQAVKEYKRQYLDKGLGELDESGTRLLINDFLTNILCFKMIEEVKTEYMIRGTYADYVVQINGNRHFLVEVKALSLNLSDKHIRQSINYGANEGIDWVLLTNGRCFQLYKVLFEKPISADLVFSIDLQDSSKLKNNCLALEYLHKESIAKNGLNELWKKHSALSTKSLSKLIYSEEVAKFIQKKLKKKVGMKFDIEEIENAIKRVAFEPVEIELVKSAERKQQKKTKINIENNTADDSNR
jgi:predicted type IV restriction endonuclease